ncbi:MAG TPA: O-antigen ligase family protein [Candidatus Acidoferrales bacterium]|nr:O-antigen ligase family protein [Candidatus Acidoferrales bacterium]
MTTVNTQALLRTLIVYAICVPLAVAVGYLITDPLQQQTILMEAVVLGFLVLPVLTKWHYPLLILSWSLPVTLFFLPGHPYLYLIMVAVSLTMSVIERIMDRNRPSLHVPSVRWPLAMFLLVIVITAKLTGGFGLRSMGSEVYGGKKYVFLAIGILSFFAVAARPIPKKDVKLYVTLFFIGGVLSVVQDLYSLVPDPLRYIYLLIPPADYSSGFGDTSIVLGRTRLAGIAGAGGAVFYWMLARHGFRENVFTSKLWRPAVLTLTLACVCLGGYRSSILAAIITVGLIFYLEKMHRTGAMIAVLLLGLLGGVLLIPLAPHLPYTFQRCLAFLPLDISTDARMDADDSTQWRLTMWEALLPQVPKYLWKGKGYAFSAETYDESISRDSAFHNSMSAADDPLALASDFHSGPLSLVLPFGIWGVLAWLWFWVAGFFVVWRNYRYGDPELRHINVFIYASFITKCLLFLFVAGSVVTDVAAFTGLVGLSVAINHGVQRRKPLPVARPADSAALQPRAYGRPVVPLRPALPALPGRNEAVARK